MTWRCYRSVTVFFAIRLAGVRQVAPLPAGVVPRRRLVHATLSGGMERATKKSRRNERKGIGEKRRRRRTVTTLTDRFLRLLFDVARLRSIRFVVYFSYLTHTEFVPSFPGCSAESERRLCCCFAEFLPRVPLGSYRVRSGCSACYRVLR